MIDLMFDFESKVNKCISLMSDEDLKYWFWFCAPDASSPVWSSIPHHFINMLDSQEYKDWNKSNQRSFWFNYDISKGIRRHITDEMEARNLKFF